MSRRSRTVNGSFNSLLHIQGETSMPADVQPITDEERGHLAAAMQLMREVSPENIENIFGTAQDWDATCQRLGIPPRIEVDRGPEL